MQLEFLTEMQCEIVRKWRNECRQALRTPYSLTEEMQRDFYRDIVCNRNALDRYWAILMEQSATMNAKFLGMGGLTNIQWQNHLAEISLIMDPNVHGKGFEAVHLLLQEAFDRMGLKTVCGECYGCNTLGLVLWDTAAEKYGAYHTTLPNRKFWAGKFWDSYYFSIDADDWRRVHESA